VTRGDADLFEQAPCGYAVLDSAGLVVAANAELLRLVGRAREDVVGVRTLPSLVSAGGRIYFDTHIFPMLAVEGAVREVALDVVRPDGDRVPVLLNANADLDDRSGVRLVRVVLLEARDRRRYETDLLEAMRSTEEARRVASELAVTLQQTLIPPSPPRVQGLAISAAYRPAGDGSEVGGDFYDVFQVSDDAWVVVIGDVRGKGVSAAMVTAFVRHTVRELAMQVPDPVELLRRLDRALAHHDTERFCTLVLARLDFDGERWTMTGSAGGHPLPLLRQADGTVSELGAPGSLLGILTEPVFRPFSRVLTDELVVMYTDGVVEARRGGELYGDRRLIALVADSQPDVEVVTTRVIADVLDFQAGDANDDIAVLALQVAVPEGPGAGPAGSL
jgi:sigma-B regulation protein RsbU (phosphoserine phosphatase)